MSANVGGIDKILRIVIGVVLILLAVTGKIGWWGYIGIVPLLTGLTGRCALYSMLGINTCPMSKK